MRNAKQKVRSTSRPMRVEPVNDTTECFKRTLADAFPDERYHAIEEVSGGYRRRVPVPAMPARGCRACKMAGCPTPQACHIPEPAVPGHQLVRVLQRLFRRG